MTEQEKQDFQKLTQIRTQGAELMGKRFLRGMWDSIVLKYSDQAHFIYELIQNADDAGAKTARFILDKEQLVFAHDGTRLFSISNPDTEDEDTEHGTLGDINAITSVANSNKTDASIGKFGVGFKAVFQYTASPRIYGPNLRFRIDRYIVPTPMSVDYPGRHEDETLFVFPFDREDMSAEDAYSDISEKLMALTYPLLFLSHLNDISFEFGDTIGLYEKRSNETRVFDQTTAQYLTLTQNSGEDIYDKLLWLFTRNDSMGRMYSCGFFIDETGKLCAVNEPAFCFFLTKEVTGLNFIIHAPFLLTDSREGIRAGVSHNVEMINLLSQLAADSLLYLRDIGLDTGMRLIDDDIISIIPYDEDMFNEVSDKRKISFKPFYTAIKEMFSKSRIIPSRDSYVESCNAYLGAVTQLSSLFTNVQLAEITGNANAEWAFPSIGRDGIQRNDPALCDYIDEIVKTSVAEEHILNSRRYYAFNKDVPGIPSDFVERQSIEWLHSFYKWLSETKYRTDVSKRKAIFLDQNRKATTAFDLQGKAVLFMPTNEMTECATVYPELLNNETTVKFFEVIGIKEPSIKDYIYTVILPLYESNGSVDTDSHFLLFFKYYRQCPQEEQESFIEMIKRYKFLRSCQNGVNAPYRYAANTLYFPYDLLRSFFAAKQDTMFVALDEYMSMVGEKNEKYLVSFLTELGVCSVARLFTVDISFSEVRERSLPQKYSTRDTSWKETRIDGCHEIIKSIIDRQSVSESVTLWNELLQEIDANCDSSLGLDHILAGRYSYFYRRRQNDSFLSSDAELLKNSAWLVNAQGDFVAPNMVTIQTLSALYDIGSDLANKLIEFLGINATVASAEIQTVKSTEDDSHLSDTQREQIILGKQCEQLGLNDADLLEAAERKRQRAAYEAKMQATVFLVPGTSDLSFSSDAQHITGEVCADADKSSMENVWEHEQNIDVMSATNSEGFQDQMKPQQKKLSQMATKVIRDIVSRAPDKPSAEVDPSLYYVEDEDGDEYTRPTIDYSARIERAKQKSAGEISRIEYFEELQHKATSVQRYSYEWFTILLEMESLSNGENNLSSREVAISFARVEREPDTHRTLVLKYPNRSIPQFMEDLADIPLTLSIGEKTKTVAIEVANIKSYTLRVKLKANVSVDDIDLTQVTEAHIEAKSPAFLLEELRKQFVELELGNNYDMRANLCNNIEFIFGPPGTGKTTCLAKNIILPLMKQQDDLKVLVLTPTNKAADVLLNRIIDVAGSDMSYLAWLVRFGTTQDEVIESSPIFRDKMFDIRSLTRSVTVTTIARFPYDFFMTLDAHIYLRNINWDYIIIDEASMIPLANVIYPLYKKTPTKFIIAGDPFQIEPITAIDLWKDENIYSMVQLNSFVTPRTVPRDYKVTLLTTQYRSTPVLGEVFSKFTYGGVLKHHRSQASRCPLNIEAILPVKSLNLIKFPVSKYESIYRSKRLQKSSSYQVYSAIFTYEFVSFLAGLIAKTNPMNKYRIGVIAPYRAQADLVDKLLASADMPDKVDVQVGTIHGFQGDECNIILAVFNTPPSISASKEMFLNKRNIINVSISRAKDYMFILMPDDNTYNIENLGLVNRIEQLMKDSGDCAEFSSNDIEQIMFGNPNYIEENAFSTGHQSVNVYGLPERCYEVRSEDNAVDVQIHKEKKVERTH